LNHSAKDQESQRLRAAAALAIYDPDNPLWRQASLSVAEQLVQVSPISLAGWMQALRPVAGWLTDPIADIFHDTQREATERSLAANILADYAAKNPERLASLLLDADEKQFAILFPNLIPYRHRSPAILEEVFAQSPLANESNAEKQIWAKRRANAAIALAKLDEPERLWPLLKSTPEPQTRSYLIHRLGPMGVDPAVLISRLHQEQDPSVRQALILSLGEYVDWEAGNPQSQCQGRLEELYRTDPDPGVHAAAQWLLRRGQQGDRVRLVIDDMARDVEKRKQTLDSIRQSLKITPDRPGWFINSQGQEMVVVPAAWKNAWAQANVPGWNFAIATKEVTVAEFLRFRQSHAYQKQYAPTLDCPVNSVTWYEAASYCNWLSQQDGITQDQWCYEPNQKGEYAAGMRLAKGFMDKTGYRLPTESEWERAGQAGPSTETHYGIADELLPKYSWFLVSSSNRSHAVASLKPNDLGLFDLYGNVWEWCNDTIDRALSTAAKEKADLSQVQDHEYRVVRGGSFTHYPGKTRNPIRGGNVPTDRFYDLGFRPARTVH
jgi:formylglycine-generating enzyme required for sulfatase activity